MKLSIVIPCKNEERRLGATLARIGDYLREHPGLEAEVIVVDNGSTDRTRRVAESCRDLLPALRVIEEARYGKGWAVRRGMLAAAGELRLFMDADNSTDIAQVEDLVARIRVGYDVAIGSRRLPGSKLEPPQPLARQTLGDLFSVFVAAVVPTDIADTQNGFKLFTRAATYHLFSQLRSFYWAFDVELLARARRDGLRVAEVPIRWVNDERSQMNLKGMARMLVDVFATRLRLWEESLARAWARHQANARWHRVHRH